MQRMRILLQQERTGLYFEDIGTWTPESTAAMDFVSSASAMEFCARNNLSGMQIVLKFQQEKAEIVLPLRGHGHTRHHHPDQAR
jgi:hypothetical protein